MSSLQVYLNCKTPRRHSGFPGQHYHETNADSESATCTNDPISLSCKHRRFGGVAILVCRIERSGDDMELEAQSTPGLGVTAID